MLKRFLRLIKKNEVAKDEIKEVVGENEEISNIESNIENEIKNDTVVDTEIINDEKENEDIEIKTEVIETNVKEYESEKNENVEGEIKEKEIKENKDVDIIYSDAEIEFIRDAKIKRGRTIKSIDLYTKEEKVFKTHSECSKKLKIPIGYIKENLKYGYTDYLGEAIIYLNKELQSGNNDSTFDYLNMGKSPMEIYNNLNNRIFSSRISDKKREAILSNEKIEPINMHYTFESIDEDYDDYFAKYKSIIQRGGKKKIELVDKKGEAIEIFKSLDECSNYLNKDKSDIVDMLKYGETKAGRYNIRYSLRNI